MNIAALLTHSNIATNGLQSKVKESSPNAFGEFLTNKSTHYHTEPIRQQLDIPKEPTIVNKYIEAISDQLMDKLSILFEDDQKMDLDVSDQTKEAILGSMVEHLVKLDEASFSLLELDNEEKAVLNTILEKLSEEENHEQNVSWLYPAIYIDIKPSGVFMDDNHVEEKFATMEAEIAELVTGEHLDSFTKNGKLLNLLEQWTTLTKSNPEQASLALTKQMDTESNNVWSQLLSNYQKRMNIDSKTSYQTNTSVTPNDVRKWLESAISRMDMSEIENSSKGFSDQFISTAAISQLEQFTVHVAEPTGDHQKFANQLLEKFELAISKSTFMSSPNGAKQLMLRITPASLGEIMVQLTEIDGEMLVKITATTQATKEALEANLKELRHMFSPQQVVIEKQEPQDLSIGKQEWVDQHEEQLSQSSDQKEQRSNDQEQSQNGDYQERSFEEILMNERV
ncbi:flagellar hook-length control protein FliK [Natronobacillus azotifigens]|uniref:Flagellar hook-length control protein FliK n=1 Tax=Natronobacillus azotifigens TaxID=472978 RepID=A0A9J6RAG5_9BACI|nr:flagellar hook-length control protein FliK [Natronobacillus azotifigens]MCZ0702565.1 flagellar hook-length control protein FliK [Natronobacillus azotifigens]